MPRKRTVKKTTTKRRVPKKLDAKRAFDILMDNAHIQSKIAMAVLKHSGDVGEVMDSLKIQANYLSEVLKESLTKPELDKMEKMEQEMIKEKVKELQEEISEDVGDMTLKDLMERMTRHG